MEGSKIADVTGNRVNFVTPLGTHVHARVQTRSIIERVVAICLASKCPVYHFPAICSFKGMAADFKSIFRAFGAQNQSLLRPGTCICSWYSLQWHAETNSFESSCAYIFTMTGSFNEPHLIQPALIFTDFLRVYYIISRVFLRLDCMSYSARIAEDLPRVEASETSDNFVTTQNSNGQGVVDRRWKPFAGISACFRM